MANDISTISTPQAAPQTILVVGATGAIGSETARTLLQRGFRVRAVTRNAERAQRDFPHLAGVEWVPGDALRPEQVLAAARGVSAIVHAANPPGYKNWQGLVLPMLESSIQAAKAVGARVVLIGNVYNFGPDAPDLVDETAPQHPVTRKGKLRVQAEERLLAASREGVPALVVRAGDFFGPRAPGSWFAQGFVKPGRPLKSVSYPGRHERGHAFAYLPDLALTIARLLERAAELGPFEVFHFAGHSPTRGVELAEATRRVAGIPSAPIRSFPWFALYLAAPFNETLRELLEMRYLWQRTLLLDNKKLVAFLGEEPHTPLEQALRDTLGGLGCLPQPRGRTQPAATASATPVS